MLTKKECLEALGALEMEIMNASSLPYTYKERVLSVSGVLFKLIKEHFELQLTSNECNLIISSLKPLEEELGMDVTLLIDKLRKIKSTVPRQEGVVECVEFD